MYLHFFRLNREIAFPPRTPSLSSSLQPSTSEIASRLSVTLAHLSDEERGGKNGWSVPNNILLLPTLRLAATFVEEPDLYLSAREITSLTNPSSSGP